MSDPRSTSSAGDAAIDAEVGWRTLVAIGVVAGDLSPLAIARYGTVHPALAAAAVDVAVDEGILVDGVIAPIVAAEVVAELDPRHKAAIHAAVARHLMTQGPSRLEESLEHAAAAGELVPLDEQVSVAEQAGRTALSIGDYDSAHRLLTLADRLDLWAEPVRRIDRLADLADALHGLGRVNEARDCLARGFDLAEMISDGTRSANLAVRYAYPVDWYAGDVRASALLNRAAALDPGPEERIALMAARAAVEMRIPLPAMDGQQLSWITRASLAQPLADDALVAAGDASPFVRLTALLAWRTTHRAPEFLGQRLEATREALDLAQSLRLADRQVDAALMLAVDALESVDRPLFERALSVARWVADRDGNPRLGWHTATVAARAALLDGDVEDAERHQRRAAELGASIGAPGWVGADLSIGFQIALHRGDPIELAQWTTDDDHPALSNPIGRICLAQVQAILGDTDAAGRNLRRAMRGFDPEASLLQNAVRAGLLVGTLGIEDLIQPLIDVLEPWRDRYAVDSNAWWCDGPVALALSALNLAAGRVEVADADLDLAGLIARRLGDTAALRTADDLRGRIGFRRDRLEPGRWPRGLTRREVDILHLIAHGYTNNQIAEQLAFSVSTIRSEVSSIYRKLGVRSRSEAVTKAIALGVF